MEVHLTLLKVIFDVQHSFWYATMLQAKSFSRKLSDPNLAIKSKGKVISHSLLSIPQLVVLSMLTNLQLYCNEHEMCCFSYKTDTLLLSTVYYTLMLGEE